MSLGCQRRAPTSRAAIALGLAVTLLAALLPRVAGAASLFDPALRFRTIATEHFRIHFHQGEERLAARLAEIAEQTWRELQVPFATTPPRRTHVVLANQSEDANGWATPLPYNTIVISATWPTAAEAIGHTTDWLRMVFVHEFTHIVHLDRSVGWARVVRNIFGRTAVAFPNLFLPTWQIEGLATYQESAVTGSGRVYSAPFRALEREAARVGQLEPLDRVNGGLTDWPGGTAPYAYGLGFHEFLASRHGAERLGRLARATAGRAPYFGSGAFKDIFGRSLGELWREYQASLTAAAQSTAAVEAPATRLTHHGFNVVGARFAPPLCPACAPEVIYSTRNAHEFPAMYSVALDGSPPRRVIERYEGATTASSGPFLLFDQRELHRNIALYSDLYRLDRRTGNISRLTSQARLTDADVADGGTIVAVREGAGRRELVRLEGSLDTSEPAVSQEITVLVSEEDTQFNTPRWSPDGRTIAVVRHRPGSQAAIVLVDVASREVRTLAALPGARVVTPAWRPDGMAVIAAGEVDGVFNLFEFPLDSGAPRQLTRTAGGAMWPTVSPDGNTLVFTGYTVEGFDLFAMPYPHAAPVSNAGFVTTSPAATLPIPPSAASSDLVAKSRAYRPWETLKPTSWSPIVESAAEQLRVGVATGGYDVLAYHGYAVAATWLVDGPSGAPRPPATPDWSVAYAYDRWRPIFVADASSTTSFFAIPDAGGNPVTTAVRDRDVEAGVLVPFRRVRHIRQALATIRRTLTEYELGGPQSVGSVAARFGIATSSARSYGYSISIESGLRAGMTAERSVAIGDADGDASAATLDLRTYLPGFARHHVVALRGGGGVSSGDAALARIFAMGGAYAEPDVISFARDAFSLMRGFPSNSFIGRRIAAVNAEYRFPIARPQRGIGTLPLFLHSVHAAAFADVGHTWTGVFHAGDVKTSAGAEVSVDVLLGYGLPLTITAGAARGHDGAGRLPDAATAYMRIGGSF